LYLKFNPQFGGNMKPEDRIKYAQSPNWDGRKFVNLEETNMDIPFSTIPSLLYKQFTNTKARFPQRSIPVVPFDAKRFTDQPKKPKFIWYGHAVLLLQLNGKNLLIDPMFGPDTTPIAPLASKRFSENTLAIIDELPPIDAVLITHDHYDHVDYASIKKLVGKIDTYFVSLGMARHLVYWGINPAKITEFDWWDALDFNGIKITFTPSRHFSGRGLSDRFKVLWGGWVFQTADYSIYWSGDGGYGQHFKTVGERLGPFDWAFMECGQYNEAWRQSHLFPEESVQGGIDAGGRICIPYHWGGFALAMHAWSEPVERFVAKAAEEKMPICTPRIGEVVVLGEETNKQWWEEI
ncbi:MAG: MBL fold metallo-hydrolase, partial [Bacteroidota bacterium]